MIDRAKLTSQLNPGMRRCEVKPAAYPFGRLIVGIAGMILVLAMII